MGCVSSKPPINSWFDFEDELRKLNARLREDRKAQDKPEPDDPIFRGVGNSEWKLETTLERSYPLERCDETTSLRRYYRKIDNSKPMVETLTQRSWDQVPDFPEFDRELKEHHGLAQHISLATPWHLRILDLSKTPRISFSAARLDGLVLCCGLLCLRYYG